MTKLPTRERLLELLDYEPDTKVFRWKIARQAIRPGAIAAPNCSQICIDNVLCSKTQLIALLTGEQPRFRSWSGLVRPWESLGLTYSQWHHRENRSPDLPPIKSRKRPKRSLVSVVGGPPPAISESESEASLIAHFRALGLPEENITAHIKGLKQARIARQVFKTWREHNHAKEDIEEDHHA